MTLDEIRYQRPGFGFAIYAYTPHGPVTLEVHAPDGSIFTFEAPTEAAALAAAFPAAPASKDVFG